MSTNRQAIVDAALGWVGTPLTKTTPLAWAVDVLIKGGALPAGDYTHANVTYIMAELVDAGMTHRRGTWPEPGDMFIHHVEDERSLAFIVDSGLVVFVSYSRQEIVQGNPSEIEGRHAKVWVLP